MSRFDAEEDGRDDSASSQLLLVDSLLRRLNRSGEAVRDRRVESVLRRIEASRRRRRLILPGSLTAALVLAAVTLFLIGDSAPAQSTLDRLIETQAELSDRSYLITVLADDGSGERVPRGSPDQLRKDLRHPRRLGPRLGWNRAVLHARGTEAYVLTRVDRRGELFVTGSDGSESFLVRPRGAVEVRQDARAFRGALPELGSSVPFLDLREGLGALRERYELERERERPASSGGAPWIELRFRAADGARVDARLVHVWFDPTTFAVHRIQYDGLRRGAFPGIRRLTVDLLEQRPFEPGWFRHGAHHEADREVVREP